MLTVAGIVIGIAAAIGGQFELAPLAISAVSAATSISGAALTTFTQQSPDPSVESEFNIFVNVSASINALDQVVQNRLQAFVDGALNANLASPLEALGFAPHVTARAYANDPAKIPSLLENGTFATPIPDLPESIAGPTGMLAAAFAAPVMNAFWQCKRTVIVKASATSLSNDPCDGDNYFSKSEKYYNDDNDMYAVIMLPSDPSEIHLSAAPGSYNPPGFHHISSFGLDVKTITRAASNYQQRNSSASNGTPIGNLASAIAGINPRDTQLVI
ncbi:uncharacterized protein BDZ99DRAFT_36225 [Mytilinidion resinicola]|uniref:Uncharacterized protein n=1 Tax=Mytilinidion resinicola TaxID=574789 RepID=A0A6A6YLM0_9PEZI|nr:uncharacterized protein BDZ99DRAFT_36225 [Mytilinidion resinicola]KAF2809772.1 hypothetical protein BDZ99DRAFT_36225 [Mytilinidion resinicola]